MLPNDSSKLPEKSVEGIFPKLSVSGNLPEDNSMLTLIFLTVTFRTDSLNSHYWLFDAGGLC